MVNACPITGEPKKATPTANRVAHQLQDILKWKLQLHTTYQTPQSARLDTDRVQGGKQHGLPFGLAHVLDSTTTGGTDQPDEITTEAGIDKWLRFWVPWYQYWTGHQATNRKTPGPWILQQLQENQVFQNITDWDPDDVNAWNEHAAETATVWHKLRHATGNQPLTRSTCPHCKTGRLQSPPTRTGYTDTATCTKCNLTLDHTEIQAEQAATLRSITTTDENQRIWIYGKQAIDLYNGALTWAKLRDWHQNGQLERKGNRRAYAYPLDQLNNLLQSQ